MDERRFVRQYEAVLIEEDVATGRRAYRLAEDLDEDVRQVTVTALKGRVLKVDLEFSDLFVHRTGWFDLVWRYAEKYGPSRLFQVEGPYGVTDVVEWGDGSTHLVLRHVWRGRSDGTMQSDYFVTYADSQYPLESYRSKSPFAQSRKDNVVE